MSTDFSCEGQVIANRFALGKVNGGGSCLQMQVTVAEWQDFRDFPVKSELGTEWESGAEWMAEQMAKCRIVRWLTASELNAQARNLENGRFANYAKVRAEAARLRRRAKYAVKDALKTV